MNKSRMRYSVSMLLLCLCLILNSCKKDAAPKLTDAEQIQLAKEWYQKTQTGLSSTIRTSSGKIAKLIFNPEWDKAKVEYIENSPSITLSVETNLEKIGTTPAHYSLVIIQNNKGYLSKTVSVKSLKSGVDKQLTTEQLYAAAFSKTDELSAINGLNAEVKVYGNHFTAEKHTMYSGTEKIAMETQKPQLFQSIGEKGLGDVKMPDKSMVRTCTNFYLNVKEYNYSGALINETNTFLYQNCYGVDDGENTEIDWIEDDTPGGGVTDEYEEETITWGEAISTDLGVNIESSTSSEKRFIAKWKPYTAPGGIYFESYEKINLQKDVFGHWVVQNLDHLSMSAVGSSTNQSIEPILNYAEDTSSQNWASVLLSYKDKRVRLKAGKTVISISDEMKSSRAWGVGDLTSNH